MAVVAMLLGAFCAQAQNAAQKAALQQMGMSLSRARAMDVTSETEASNTSLNFPGGLAYDTAGNLYIANTAENQILEVSTLGVISVIAGTGEQGFGGDEAAATLALLNRPMGIVIDSLENIYIADAGNQRIRQIDVNGVIHTLAGTGVAGFSGDGGLATEAELSHPTAVAIDARSYLYIADTENHRIRAVAGTTITTVAGNGEQYYSGDGVLATDSGLDSPQGVAVDSSYNLYISDTNNQRVRMVTYATGLISTLAGDGVMGFTSATGGELANPHGLTVDSSGTVYFADTDNQRIRSISGGQMATVAGDGEQGGLDTSGVSTSVSLNGPLMVAVQSGNVSVSDTQNQLVRVVSGTEANTVAGDQSIGAESLSVSGQVSFVYGSGALVATFSNGSNTISGPVTFTDGLSSSPVLLGTISPSANKATLNTSLLSVGTHRIVASYAGDASNGAISSGVYVLTMTPVQLTASANGVTLLYGQSIPALSGSLSSVLTQDAGNVSVVFATQATSTSVPQTYPITATLSGTAAGNYTVALGSNSGSVVIQKAPSKTSLSYQSSAASSGTSVTLTANVSSTTSGTPSGSVSFYDGTTLLNSSAAVLSQGSASFTYSTSASGTHSFIAVYGGDSNFTSSTSASNTAGDFTQAVSGVSTQAVVPGEAVSYSFTLTPTAGIFTDAVSFSVSGLPAGATASFSPATIAAGSAATSVTMTVQTAKTTARNEQQSTARKYAPLAFALLLLPLAGARRIRKQARSWMVLLFFVGALAATLGGCGGYYTQGAKSYTVTITATSGSLSHTSTVTLTVE
jgi:sugar lactone lactonase YvrE